MEVSTAAIGRMNFPDQYACLSHGDFSDETMTLSPLRYQDRHVVRAWRNCQTDILRQSTLITYEEQDRYFDEVVAIWYTALNPEGILFGIYIEGELIGYGGLVHVDWLNDNAEVSFLLADSDCTELYYLELFGRFLGLVELVAAQLELHKIYCVGFDVQRFRFNAFARAGFVREAQLQNHVYVQEQPCNVLIHAKLL